MKTKIIWISSYPKSGNTWMRYLISNYFFNKDDGFDEKIINNINNFPKDAFFHPFIKKEEIFSNIYSSPPYWIKAQENIETSTGNIFLKTHNSMCQLNNDSFTNEDLTSAVILIVRDPRDVVISYSNFTGETIDQNIKFMTSKKLVHRIDRNRGNYVPEFIGSWKFNYLSWKKSLPNTPKIIVRYEDLLNNPNREFEKVIRFLSLILNFRIDPEQIKLSVNLSDFKTLQSYEKNNGFFESSKHGVFFREGKTQQWKKKLNNRQIKLLEKTFYEEMKELKYL
ncbi:MAG: hypothetical protein CMP16_03890 [Rickettsiales bacterium]|nr:hypothetical protein [Rickettsiales bacterium]